MPSGQVNSKPRPFLSVTEAQRTSAWPPHSWGRRYRATLSATRFS